MKSWEQIGEWLVRRQTVVIVGASALAVTLLSVGGAMALMREDRPFYEVAAERATADAATRPIPSIVTDEAAYVTDGAEPGALRRMLGMSRTRSAETVAAGEAVYTAAQETAHPGVLERLRGALDEASRVLDERIPAEAGAAEREHRVEELEAQRATILDAASMITQVRHVPAAQLPDGMTTLAVLPDAGPEDDPTASQTASPSPQPPSEPTEEPSGAPTDEEPSVSPSPSPTTTPDDPSASPTPSAGLTDRPAPSPSEPSADATDDGLFSGGTPTPTSDPSASPSGSPAG